MGVEQEEEEVMASNVLGELEAERERGTGEEITDSYPWRSCIGSRED